MATVVFSCAGNVDDEAEDLQSLVDGLSENMNLEDEPDELEIKNCEKNMVDDWDNFIVG